MLPETGNGKRNEKRERYEKRSLEVSHSKKRGERKITKMKVLTYIVNSLIRLKETISKIVTASKKRRVWNQLCKQT